MSFLQDIVLPADFLRNLRRVCGIAPRHFSHFANVRFAPARRCRDQGKGALIVSSSRLASIPDPGAEAVATILGGHRRSSQHRLKFSEVQVAEYFETTLISYGWHPRFRTKSLPPQ